MRWKPRKKPEYDDVRLKNKFLLWPTKLKNDLTGETEWRWLEFATVKQVYEFNYNIFAPWNYSWLDKSFN